VGPRIENEALVEILKVASFFYLHTICTQLSLRVSSFINI